MTKGKAKSAVWLLVVALCLSMVLPACSKNANSGSESKQASESPLSSADASQAPETAQASAQPVKFSFYGHYDWMTTEPWGEDPASKWIQENKGVTVEPIQSGGQAAAKLNTMIASNSLPDVIQLDRGGTDFERMRTAGLLVPLDDYIAKYPNLRKWAGDDTLNMLRSDDGKIYQFPNWYTSSPNGNGGWIVNQKIYKELGSPELKTFDDLYAYLSKVKQNYPDVVPLEIENGNAGFEVIYTGFAENRNNLLFKLAYPAGDQLKSIYEDPAFSEMMLYVSKLFREKLISQDVLTQKQDQIMEKLSTGRVAVYVDGNVTATGEKANFAVKANDPQGGYEAIWPLHKTGLDPEKIFPNTWNSLGWNVNVITRNAKDPEAIFAYFDWLTGQEGQRVTFFGPPGLYWNDVDDEGAPIPNELWKSTTPEEKNKQKLMAFDWAGNTTFVDTTKTKLEMMQPEEQRSWIVVTQANITWKTSMNATEYTNLTPLPDSEEGIILQRVADLNSQMRAKVLFAKSDEEVTSLIEKSRQDTDKMGIDKLLAFMTERWQENLRQMAEK